jgi:hypothetical protein
MLPSTPPRQKFGKFGPTSEPVTHEHVVVLSRVAAHGDRVDRLDPVLRAYSGPQREFKEWVIARLKSLNDPRVPTRLANRYLRVALAEFIQGFPALVSELLGDTDGTPVGSGSDAMAVQTATDAPVAAAAGAGDHGPEQAADPGPYDFGPGPFELDPCDPYLFDPATFDPYLPSDPI